MNDIDIEYIAILRIPNNETEKYRMEYLYFSPTGEIRDPILAIANSQDVDRVLLLYRKHDDPIKMMDYDACKKMLESGEITPDDIPDLL